MKKDSFYDLGFSQKKNLYTKSQTKGHQKSQNLKLNNIYLTTGYITLTLPTIVVRVIKDAIVFRSHLSNVA